ncbi:transcriptional regulator NanR [Aquabacterium sp. OR-4]|uniref:transcriptional regulator NanR n=1 Tax=Aquabacterium sp. OR-4 TaxID=2978127 RepID=UPI0021B17CA0|nr:transcriptional regulator NanR [Aquabacterium sp. OR-4]MDT7838729.1 transcriptional regulator NanR [Aquabacterium sp. OR-4]
MTGDPIQRRKLYQEVLARLQERIRSGELAPGDHLPSERELMAFYGVGRPAVREALQELARSGIVEISHGERARVVVPTAQLLIAQIAGGAQHLLRMQPDMLGHLKEARVFLEAGLARLAAERATPADVARLRQRLAEHRASLAALDQFLNRDMAFHREIAAVAGNPIFPAIVEALFNWASEYYRSIVRAPGAESLTLAEHERIVEAIAAHDAAGAEQAMRDHLLRANALYRQADAPAARGTAAPAAAQCSTSVR